MRPLSVLRLASAFLCLSSIYAFSQYTVKRVTFTGVTPYTDADLQAVSGLHPGLGFNKDDLQAAAQRLIDTGAFDDVQVALDGPFKTISVNFTLKPADSAHILKVSSANLIWWQPEELQSALHAKLPLFNGTLPEAGNQQDAAEDALKQLLIEKGITASLTHEVIEPNLLQPRLVEFKVSAPEIRLHGATITGASAALSTQIDKITASANGSLYNEGLTSHSLTERILNLYRDTGNLDASLVQLHRAPQSTTTTRIDIDLTATIQEGQPYRISSIAFPALPS
jgi:outer membrane protein assembly factor BamA